MVASTDHTKANNSSPPPPSTPGHSLGGSPHANQLTPSEIRERRLAKLQGGSMTTPRAASQQTPIQSPSSVKKTTSQTPSKEPSSSATPTKPDAPPSSPSLPAPEATPPNNRNTTPSSALASNPWEATTTLNNTISAPNHALPPTASSSTQNAIQEDDENDEELQKALAMSLAGDTEDEEENDPDTMKWTAASQLGSILTFPSIATLSSRVQQWYATAEATPILDFHSIMWDTSVTTESDQQRWLSQGIHYKRQEISGNMVANHTSNSLNTNHSQDNIMMAMIANQEVWGLTQAHGGPCGVLASIQAEILRLLLFGPRNHHPSSPENDNDNEPSSATKLRLDFPILLTDTICGFQAPDLDAELLQHALALAMGRILARAAIASSATLNDTTNNEQQDASATSPPATATPTSAVSQQAVIKLVLPKPTITGPELQWSHFHPWTAASGGSGISNCLITYTISEQSMLDEEQAFKRARMGGTGDSMEVRVQALATCCAQFLLETEFLQWFHREGGVLLFVASIALSRNIPTIQGDMDDTTAKLTSNFGHCAQELLNVLLAGQAVSNVFDRTLRPSGELICRGIQERPDIGYLTQLESMRYVEVGGFFKRPKYPIWVVGSTSHFTVMFGDATSLRESVSDRLLEKVRRVFKQMDSGESGFLPAAQLGALFKAVGGLDHIPETSVQTIAASMEVPGAGIILWEDLWKRTSRLLTGASIESVLEAESIAPSTAIVVAPTPAPIAESTPLSDEELARRLQAEWNGETTSNPPQPPPAPASGPAANSSTGTGKKETYGKTFQLYHYNGLRGGAMKPFRVTRLSADEAIGASVSLGSNASNQTGDLEDILRSKWPSCKIDWLGGVPPSID